MDLMGQQSGGNQGKEKGISGIHLDKGVAEEVAPFAATVVCCSEFMVLSESCQISFGVLVTIKVRFINIKLSIHCQ